MAQLARRRTIFVVIAASLAFLVAALFQIQHTRPPIRPNPPGPRPETLHLNVSPESGRGIPDYELQAEMARRMNEADLPAPEVRLQHFLGEQAQHRSEIVGWGALVIKVDGPPERRILTIRVFPAMGLAVAMSYTEERYQVSEDGVEFLDGIAGPPFSNYISL